MNLRNLTVTNFIGEGAARSIIAKALEGNPSRATVIVEGLEVTFVEIPSQRFTIVTIRSTTRHTDSALAMATIDDPEEPGDPSKVTVICSSCFGRGSVSTGITECPTTICERCNGTGKV